MKRCLILSMLCAAVISNSAQETAPLFTDDAEQIAFDPNLLVQPAFPNLEMAPPIEPRSSKSTAMAVGLSSLFPGLGHIYLGEKNAAAGLMGSALAGMGGVALSQSNERAFLSSLVALQSVWSYGIYSSYRDARLYNGNAGYSYRMPSENFAELSLSPFKWRVLKKPEVWGGLLGAIGLAAAAGYFIHLSEARLPATSTADVTSLSPALAFPIGIGEEALFRGYLQSQLIETLGPRGGIAVTALAFGAAHIPNALALEPEDRKNYYAFSLPVITALGAYMGWLTYKNTSLQESVALHSWYDFTLLAVSALARQTASTGRPGFALALPF